jgi:hypothetical protein
VYAWNNENQLHSDIKILSIGISYWSKRERATKSAATLVLMAPVIPYGETSIARLHWNSTDSALLPIQTRVIMLSDTDMSTVGWIAPDMLESPEFDDGCILLSVARCWQASNQSMLGNFILILKPVEWQYRSASGAPVNKTYTRVGMGLITDQNWFLNAPMRKIFIE